MGNANSGGRPKPTALKLLQGNPGKRKLNEHEPKPPEGRVVRPAQLTPDAARVWDELAPLCTHMRTLTRADVAAFATLCELESTRRLASAQKTAPGFAVFLLTTTVDGNGNEHVGAKVHPAIKLEGETAVKLRSYYERFGLDPSGRARLSVPAPPAAAAPEDKWAGILT